ncbi:MAG: carboxy-S-adenosyl-L-methionine synthase CmoA, partial [Xanthomonadales bacterium]|nr:carboxy-S-adenosyl-L-methionine synthase CmoA [Xanthomonadales bacterium]
MSDEDRIYAEDTPPEPFRFTARVADVFPDMIRRSVPGYGSVLELIGVLAGRYIQPGTNCYDLGASLGAATLAMRHAAGDKDCRLVAVDSSEAMVARCRSIIAREPVGPPVEVQLADVRDLEISNASLVVMNYTLQFIEPAERDALVNRIHAGLLPGGALILSEKIQFRDPDRDQLHIDLHHDFKRSQGYSELEIARKRTALENVLIRDTLETHDRRLREAGFTTVEPFFQAFNFVSLL